MAVFEYPVTFFLVCDLLVNFSFFMDFSYFGNHDYDGGYIQHMFSCFSSMCLILSPYAKMNIYPSVRKENC